MTSYFNVSDAAHHLQSTLGHGRSGLLFILLSQIRFAWAILTRKTNQHFFATMIAANDPPHHPLCFLV